MEDDLFDIFVAGVCGVVFFICADLGVFALEVLADHDKGHEDELDDVAEEKEEGEWIGVKGFGEEIGLPDYPAYHEADEEVDGVHGADGAG